MSRHGRAVMPWGKYKGCRIRLIPDEYLSWLTTTDIVKAPRWKWLQESLMAELRFRGFNTEAVSEPDVKVRPPEPQIIVEDGHVRRKFRL